jgi:hypothetical protein
MANERLTGFSTAKRHWQNVTLPANFRTSATASSETSFDPIKVIFEGRKFAHISVPGSNIANEPTHENLNTT